MIPVLLNHQHFILTHVVVLSAAHAAHKLNLLEVAALSCWKLAHPILIIVY